MNESFVRDRAAARRQATNPAYRTLHGLHGDAPVHYGDHIVVDAFAAHGGHSAQLFVRVLHGGVESDAVHVTRPELLAVAHDINQRFGYHPDPATASEVRLVREPNGTVTAWIADNRIGAVWGPAVDDDDAWFYAIGEAVGRAPTHALAVRELLDGCGFRFGAGKFAGAEHPAQQTTVLGTPVTDRGNCGRVDPHPRHLLGTIEKPQQCLGQGGD